MYDCVSPKMVNVLHCISALCFLIIALSLFAFLFDLAILILMIPLFT